MSNTKLPRRISIALILLFVLAQFAFLRVSSGGAWCSPYLGAPQELGHPAYQFSGYGFPVELLSIVKDECFTEKSTTYEWNPIGLIVNGMILVLLAFPFWRNSFKSTNTA
jgi:hypothetical protein